MLLSHPQYVKVIASRNSVVHVQHKLSENQEWVGNIQSPLRPTSPLSGASEEYRGKALINVVITAVLTLIKSILDLLNNTCA